MIALLRLSTGGKPLAMISRLLCRAPVVIGVQVVASPKPASGKNAEPREKNCPEYFAREKLGELRAAGSEPEEPVEMVGIVSGRLRLATARRGQKRSLAR